MGGPDMAPAGKFPSCPGNHSRGVPKLPRELSGSFQDPVALAILEKSCTLESPLSWLDAPWGAGAQ